jgi:hypothetical protein
LMHGVLTLHEKVMGEKLTDWATWGQKIEQA